MGTGQEGFVCVVRTGIRTFVCVAQGEVGDSPVRYTQCEARIGTTTGTQRGKRTVEEKRRKERVKRVTELGRRAFGEVDMVVKVPNGLYGEQRQTQN